MYKRQIVFSMDELYYNKMSEEFVETLEDVVAYRISLDKLRRLFETNIELANCMIRESDIAVKSRSYLQYIAKINLLKPSRII